MHHNAHLITRESFAFYDECRDSPDRFLPLDGASYLHGCVRCWVALLSFCGSPLGSGSVPFDFSVVCVGSGFIVARLFVMLLQCIVAFGLPSVMYVRASGVSHCTHRAIPNS